MTPKKTLGKSSVVIAKKIDLKKTVQKSPAPIMPRLAGNHNETLLLK